MMSHFCSIKLCIVGVILIASTKADLIKRQADDDEVCNDAESSAFMCFEYFKLSLQWPKASCYRARVLSQSDKECNTPDSWSIHGLWPQTTRPNKSILKKKCPLDIPFNIDDLNDIKDRLTPVWFGVDISGEGDPNAKLWEHEWTKHGRCAARHKDLDSIGKFFSKTLELYDQYNIDQALNDRGISPGNTASLGDISNAIKDMVRKLPRISTISNKERTESYLYEIHICYDHDFDHVDCPEKAAEVTEPDKQIKYLKDVPSVTG
ncbi:ribonuclease Oy-like [Microplitis mediator]|uniref:ribonuclease Oy-like n=1 Tax=Microplitis mediator TaxID=375433 RepID=UPI002552DEF1|nr:ribonuclease Oy-like [Microplitis mediator]